jgi:NAD-dependent dihydropyrimidine dehydrogenase PreA subunit
VPIDAIQCPQCQGYFVPKEEGAGCPTCGSARSRYYYSRSGKVGGPISSKELRTFAARGGLAPTDLVRRAGEDRWVVAKKIRGLFPPLPAPKPSPEPPPACPAGGACIESRHEARAEAQVVPDPARCVQCGICSYNCPMEIDVRAHAHRGIPIHDSHCLTCSECVKRCPRGVLSFERIPLFTL